MLFGRTIVQILLSSQNPWLLSYNLRLESDREELTIAQAPINACGMSSSIHRDCRCPSLQQCVFSHMRLRIQEGHGGIYRSTEVGLFVRDTFQVSRMRRKETKIYVTADWGEGCLDKNYVGGVSVRSTLPYHFLS